MKAMLAMCPDGTTAVTVKLGTKHRRWAYFIEVKSKLPVFVYIGRGNNTIKRQLIDFVEECGSNIADSDRCRQAAERLLDRQDLGVFDDDCEGQATYFNGLMTVCLRPFASQGTVVHECVHLSQFLLRYKYGNSDVMHNDVHELQADIVENLVAIVLAVQEELEMRNRR